MRIIIDSAIRTDGVVRAKAEDDVEEILDHNKHLQSTEQTMDWGHHVGSVPPIFLHKWLNEAHARGWNLRFGSKEFWAYCWQKLQDPEYSKLRVVGPRYRIGYR